MADVIIIGGGAAGLMAACICATSKKNVILINKDKQFGKKLAITGKGRCNLTNNCTIEEFLENVPANSRFLYSAINAFTPQMTMDFFEKLGVPLKTERGRRVFPVSDKASDIVEALTKFIHKSEIKTITATATALIIKDGIIKGVKTKSDSYYADKVIVATGGLSYPKTGSTGDGYKLAKQVGHTIIDTSPSLSAIVSNNKYCSELMGLSLKNVTLSLIKDDGKKKKCIYKELGEMLFTHFGVSGPLVLSSSAHIYNLDKYKYNFEIDLKPALDETMLDARILKDFEIEKNKDFQNSLSKLLPSKIVPVIVKLSEIPPQTKVNSITKNQRMDLIRLLKHFPVDISGFRPIDEAIITRGGIKLSEINPKTMESKLCSGLYFVGEVLDVDAYTGGYNLQIAFSTAYCAALNI